MWCWASSTRTIASAARSSWIARAVINGPALIEQPTTTLLLLAKQQARTDDHGNFLVEQR
jgi:N-methylhydantoinase A/oxoprolinase/acetone carboxylase beta subunit